MTREDHDKLAKLIADGYLAEDLEPLKCDGCESVNLKEEVKDFMGYLVMESETKCGDCGRVLGYWATGHWMP